MRASGTFLHLHKLLEIHQSWIHIYVPLQLEKLLLYDLNQFSIFNHHLLYTADQPPSNSILDQQKMKKIFECHALHHHHSIIIIIIILLLLFGSMRWPRSHFPCSKIESMTMKLMPDANTRKWLRGYAWNYLRCRKFICNIIIITHWSPLIATIPRLGYRRTEGMDGRISLLVASSVSLCSSLFLRVSLCPCPELLNNNAE